MRARFLIVWIVAGILPAAELPRPPAPSPKVPRAFSAQTPDTTADPIVEKWWATLGDSELNALVERAVKNNLDLEMATARLLAARASRRVARADLLPSVTSNNSFQRLRGGFQNGNIHVGNNTSGGARFIAPFETNIFQLGFDASWELDLFGGNRQALLAATADVAASEDARRDTLVSLLGEAARNYLELRGAQKRLAITRQNISLQRDSLHLTEVRAEAGLGNQLDVERQKSQLETSQALEPVFESQISQTIHRLSVLLGEEPAALAQELRAEAPLPLTPPQVPVGLPGDLLKRRPDLRRADAQVAAAAARVGVAKADLFPKFTLTGSAGRQSSDASGFTLGLGNFFAIGPGIRLPIFTGGRLRANIEVRKQQLEESMTQYRSAVLGALRETEDSLVAYGRERERRERLLSAVKASRQATQFATELYSRGLADFLSVVEAQRDQLSAEDAMAQSDTTVLTNLVAVYKALGGGWGEIYPGN
jgi:outer membrane protein, multidrug efflux system